MSRFTVARYQPYLLISLIILACWPAWRWLWQRVSADRVEGLGLLALVIAVVLLAQRPSCSPLRRPWLLPAVLLVVYLLAYHHVLPLARAALAVSIIAAALSVVRLGSRLQLSLWGLLLLALPVIPSLQFFAGYPLRALVAQLAAPLLRGAGFAVAPDGAVLRWGQQLICVDAPCSGVKMLWAGFLLFFTLALYYRLSNRRTAALAVVTLLVIILGNTLRTSGLFLTEAGIMELPEWCHAAMGLLMYGLTAAGIAAITLRAAQQNRARVSSEDVSPPATTRSVGGISRPALASLLTLLLLAALTPLRQPFAPAQAAANFPGWPTHFEERALHELPLSAREESFQQGFPGQIARFSDGHRELVMRWVTTDTRLLHPASDCYRGLGYQVTPDPLTIDSRGRHWGAFHARKNGHTVQVREIIYSADDQNWSDASSWYWSAALQRSRGPWWAVTVVEAG